MSEKIEEAKSILDELRDKYGIKSTVKDKVERNVEPEPEKVRLWDKIRNEIDPDNAADFIFGLPHPDVKNELDITQNLEYAYDFAKRYGIKVLERNAKNALIGILRGVMDTPLTLGEDNTEPSVEEVVEEATNRPPPEVNTDEIEQELIQEFIDAPLILKRQMITYGRRWRGSLFE